MRSCSYGLPIEPHIDPQIKHTTGGVVIDLHADSLNTTPRPSCFDMDGADLDSVQSVNQRIHPAIPKCAMLSGLTHRNLYLFYALFRQEMVWMFLYRHALISHVNSTL